MASKDWVSAEKQDKNSDQIEVPELRFPEFNDEWNKDCLGDLCEVNGRIGFRGYTKSDLVKAGEGALTLGGKHIDSNDELDLSDPEYLSWEKYHESPEIKVKKNNIILAQRGTLGRSALIDKDIGKATINPSMVLLKNFNINNIFLHYFLTTTKIKKEIIRKSSSTAVPMISQREIKKIKISYPSSKEQIKVSNFFSSIDKKIDLMEKTLVLYERYKKQLQNEIFNKKLIKYELKAIKLKDICTIKKGKQLNKSDMLETGEYYVLNGGKNPSGFTNSWNVNENTITISEGGNSCGYVSFNTEKFYCGGHCYYLTITSEVDNYYLFNYLKFIELKIMRLRVGSGLPNIQKGDIENLLINLPPITIQEEISLFFKFINNYILLKENEKEKMINFKKALLQQMFI